ncbi:prephenate dehydrogenase [Gordonia terrae]|uniref:prephenate dehydrogenase n=1 Tax=Gordonia terrae TaxID=2055 RepID=UPI003F6D0C60
MTADPSSNSPVLAKPVCVLGLGLIGGSLLRALHDAGHEAFGYNRSAATVDAATRDGYDASSNLVATLERAAISDALLVLATPVTTIEPLVTAIAEHAPNVLLTDVISVKQEVERVIGRLHPNGRYVGGHPMAGTNRSGWSATDATLFDGAMWAVTTTDETRAADWLPVASLAVAVGSRVVPVAPDAHDRAAAAISHLPHLTAAVTAAVGAGESGLALRLAAGSFRDGTRVAGTAPDLQRAMIEANGIAVLNVLSETIDRLVAARDELRDSGTVEVLIDDGHRARSAYEQLHSGTAEVISGVEIGDGGWQQELRRQAHQGRVWVG